MLKEAWIESASRNGFFPGVRVRCCFLIWVAGMIAGWSGWLQAVEDPWVYLDNGQVRMGVKRTSGAGIAYFSESGSTNNLINHWDHGRLVQQSYYGLKDGSLWNKQPWRWNPVQGGDWKGNPARVLALEVTNGVLYARTLPKHWASGLDLTNTLMEQWIRLTGRVAEVRYRFSYEGGEIHTEQDQEVPAVFVEPRFDTLVLYRGDKPWTGGAVDRWKPGWPNEYSKWTEPWAAYVDGEGRGVGVLVPVARGITCYRYGDGKAEHGACSYFAPLTRFAVTPGFRFEYRLWITLGTVDEMRSVFRAYKDLR